MAHGTRFIIRLVAHSLHHRTIIVIKEPNGSASINLSPSNIDIIKLIRAIITTARSWWRRSQARARAKTKRTGVARATHTQQTANTEKPHIMMLVHAFGELRLRACGGLPTLDACGVPTFCGIQSKPPLPSPHLSLAWRTCVRSLVALVRAMINAWVN